MKVQPKVSTADPMVAVIDSGINRWHSHVNGIAGGVGFHPDPGGSIRDEQGFADTIGHGTAVAGVIRHYAPHAKLYAVKIFHEHLKASAAVLMAALAWAIDNRMAIIHLSLGTYASSCKSDLERLCRLAEQQGTIIIAAARRADDDIYPACFESVIGVYHHPRCAGNEIIYHPQEKIEFGACGNPRSLNSQPDQINFNGSSFAVAHVTGRAAGLLGDRPSADTHSIRTLLAAKATEEHSKGSSGTAAEKIDAPKVGVPEKPR